MRFPLGRVIITANALNTIPENDWIFALGRHIDCDWGVVCKEDWDLNDWSLGNGERIFSAYEDCDGEKFWIITERDSSYTTILLPEDY